MPARDGSILTPAGWVRGRLRFEAGISDISGEPTERPTAPYLLPGFVDLHVHGGGGGDVMQGEDAVRTLARCHARFGTTALLATTVTAPLSDIEQALLGVEAVRQRPEPGAAQVLGAHLEGPFINPDKLGAQPPFARLPDVDLLAGWCRLAAVRVMTFAPELDEDGGLRAALLAAGVRPQVGHSLAQSAVASAAFRAGAGATHLFNAMSGFDHRAPGVVGAALAHATSAEIIPDLVHVEATAILAARRAIPKLYAVTDATAGAGMPDGPFPLGRRTAHKCAGAMRLDDGTLAGSTLTMDQALRNLVAIGLPLAEASRRTATLPALWLGLSDRGSLEVGRRADVVVLDAALAVEETIIGGALTKP
ncbi:MAG: N-acetylglucosamine-6-phosphate deacetylase [Geminicoccaceae bacterium]|nr:MAG: N-acetylglucosamine-6-phosphate deacetylase [Geminicoccaceae bacterium]